MLSRNVSARRAMIKKRSLTDNAKQRIAQFLLRSHLAGKPPFVRLRGAFWLLPIVPWVCAGCGVRTEQSSHAPGPALYGAPAGVPSKSIPRVGPNLGAQEWT